MGYALIMPDDDGGLIVSTSKPGESLCGYEYALDPEACNNGRSQPPSLENPFVGKNTGFFPNKIQEKSLNLQAWRIPLWAGLTSRLGGTTNSRSQPPSLENPFVGYVKLSEEDQSIFVSTSKPGESLCGTSTVSLNYYRESAVSTSKPGESLCGTSAGSLKHLMRRLSQPPSLENPFVG